jgi:hypothetical protein
MTRVAGCAFVICSPPPAQGCWVLASRELRRKGAYAFSKTILAKSRHFSTKKLGFIILGFF